MKTKMCVPAILASFLLAGSVFGCSHVKTESSAANSVHFKPKKQYTAAELHKRLTPEEYIVTQEAGTETAFTGKYWNNHADGIYRCIVCGAPLFDSKTKFESGTGWPSFYRPIDRHAVQEREDNSDGMQRTEVICATCGAHLGHVFDDGPQPTGLRYCINSAALNFENRK